MAVSSDATDVSADPTQVEILPETQISPHTNKPVPEGTDMKTFAVRPTFWCDICSWRVSTITSILQHFNGKSHRAKLTARDSPDQHTNGSAVAEVKCEAVDGKDVTSDLKCEVCDLNFSNAVGALQHFKGKRHEKASRKRTLDEGNTAKQTQEPEVKKKKEQPAKPTEVKTEIIKCEDCNIQFTNSAAAIPHFKGKKHTATIAKKVVAQQQARSQVSQRGTPMGGRGRGQGRGFGRGYTGNILHGNQSFTSGSLSDFQLLPSSDYRTSPLSNNYYSSGYKSDDRTNSSNFPPQLYDSY